MARKEKLFRATILVTLVIVLSKVCGFVRDMITANYFGTGIESDAYTASYSLFYLPVLLFNSCITSTLIPMYMHARKEDGKKAANLFASNAFNLFGVAAIVIAAVFYLLARPLVGAIYSGFSPEKIELTADLTQIMMLSLVFNVTSIVMSSLLNAREKFIAAQLTGFPLSLAVIAASVFFSKEYGVTALAWGVFASGVMQVLVQIPFFFGWFKYTPRINPADPRFRRLLRLAVPAMLSMAVSELNHMIDHWLSSGLGDGPMTALTYGYRLITFISGILVVPITTIMFSRLSRMVAEDDKDGILASVRRCVEVVSMVLVPVIVICALLNKDIIRFAYGSGRFDEKSVELTAGAFLFYVIGVLGFGLRDILNRTFHAMQDTATPFIAACVAVVLNIVLNFILRAVMGANGLALATTIAGSSAMLLMFFLLRRKMGALGMKILVPDFAKILVGGAVCGGVCVLMDRLLPAAQGRVEVLMRLIAVAGVSCVAYVIAELILKETQIYSFMRAFLRETGHRKKA